MVQTDGLDGWTGPDRRARTSRVVLSPGDQHERDDEPRGRDERTGQHRARRGQLRSPLRLHDERRVDPRVDPRLHRRTVERHVQRDEKRGSDRGCHRGDRVALHAVHLAVGARLCDFCDEHTEERRGGSEGQSRREPRAGMPPARHERGSRLPGFPPELRE